MSKHIISGFLICLAIVTSISILAQESDSVLFVPSAELDAFWLVEKKVAPVYPTRSLSKGEEGCVAIGYFIEADGTTSSHRAIVGYPSNNFSQSAIRAAKQFKYTPSDSNVERQVVFTTNSFTYEIHKGSKPNLEKREQLAELCTAAANKALNTDASDAGAG